MKRAQLKMFATHFDGVDKIWSGPKSSVVVDKHENLGDLLLEKLNSNPEFVTQVSLDSFFKNIFRFKFFKFH